MLAIDIGNSNTTFCRFEAGSVTWRRITPTAETDFIPMEQFFKESGASKVFLASVVKPATNIAKTAMLSAGAEEVVLLCEHKEKIIPTELETPETTGVDRLLAAAGAKEIYPGEAVVIVQAGTAITVDFVDSKGIYQGGVIMPGPEMWLDSLFSAALLPYFPSSEINWQTTTPGKSTKDAIINGAAFGLIGAVKEAVRHIARGESGVVPRLVFTGGWGEKLLDSLPGEYVQDLVINGIKIFADKFERDL